MALREHGQQHPQSGELSKAEAYVYVYAAAVAAAVEAEAATRISRDVGHAGASCSILAAKQRSHNTQAALLRSDRYPDDDLPDVAFVPHLLPAGPTSTSGTS